MMHDSVCALEAKSLGCFAVLMIAACNFEPVGAFPGHTDGAIAHDSDGDDANNVGDAKAVHADAGSDDANKTSDTGTSSTADGGELADAEVLDDAEVSDAGLDAGIPPDAGVPDAGTPFTAYPTSNFYPGDFPGPHQNWTVANGTACWIGSGTTPMINGCTLPANAYATVTMVDSSLAFLIHVNDFVTEAGSNLVFYGEYPIIVAVYGSATIAGQIDADALGGFPGAGSLASCTMGQGGNGGLSSSNRGGGGGGAGFALTGGAGGDGDDGNGPGGTPGLVDGDEFLIPLRGGCSGGDGAGPGGGRGAGGGGLQISASGSLLLIGRINAVGGGGEGGGASRGGGGGGGSGGAVLLEAGALMITATATIAVPGGGGGEGADNGADGDSGNSGSTSQVIASAGGSGRTTGANGGDSGGAGLGALPGGNSVGEAGGGGGGSVGRIRLHSNVACDPNPGAAISGVIFVDCP